MNVTADTMRAAVSHSPGELLLESRAVPTPAEGEVLIRVTSVGTCGSDVHYYEHGRAGEFVVDSPLILGHEPAGMIAAVGGGVAPSRIGQRVALEPLSVGIWACRKAGVSAASRVLITGAGSIGLVATQVARAFSLVEHGAVTLDALVTHRFGLDEVERALSIARNDDTAIKPVVRP